MAITNKATTNKDKSLSILIAQGGLSFCVHQTTNNKLISFQEINFKNLLSPNEILEELKEVFKNHLGEHHQELNQVKVIYANNLFSLVPSALFDESKLTDYLKFNIKLLQTDFVTFDNLQNDTIKNVYVPYSNINNYLLAQFGEFNYHHSLSIFIENSMKTSTNEGEFVFLNIGNFNFEICLIKDGKLLLANHFEFFTAEDFIYHTLFCIEQTKFDREELKLFISGKIKEQDETYQYLYEYIRNIEFTEIENRIKELGNPTENSSFFNENHLLLNNLL